MKTKPFMYAANWKMKLSFAQSVQFATNNFDTLIPLASKENVRIVLCPAFDALSPIAQLFKKTPLFIGAQDCSAHANGAYTGQVSAESLKDIGCKYSIVGHSERRTHNKEESQEIGQKALQLLNQSIIPIICVGETQEQYSDKQTQKILLAQLEPICSALKHFRSSADDFTANMHVCVAYEPIWAIGTGNIPTNQEVVNSFSWITEIMAQQAPGIEVQLLYGGSVTPNNAPELKKIPNIGGFLIGGASLDFQKFQNIVS